MKLIPITGFKCPVCKYVPGVITGTDEQGDPRPGEHIICMGCASWLQFDEDMQAVQVKGEELERIMKLPTYIFLYNHVSAYLCIKAAKN